MPALRVFALSFKGLGRPLKLSATHPRHVSAFAARRPTTIDSKNVGEWVDGIDAFIFDW